MAGWEAVTGRFLGALWPASQACLVNLQTNERLSHTKGGRLRDDTGVVILKVALELPPMDARLCTQDTSNHHVRSIYSSVINFGIFFSWIFRKFGVLSNAPKGPEFFHMKNSTPETTEQPLAVKASLEIGGLRER